MADHGVLVEPLPEAAVAHLAGIVRDWAGGPPEHRGPLGPRGPSGHHGPLGHRGPAGIIDVVPALQSLLVVVDGDHGDLDAVAAALRPLADQLAGSAAPTSSPPDRGVPGRDDDLLAVPVRFDGPDLEEVGAITGLGPLGVVEALTAAPLRVAFLGFAPGFAYLRGLPPVLERVPRRATPRPVVPAGTVAVAGGFAAVYPHASPGGWQLVGTTTIRLFDPDRPPFARLRPGQQVRFVRRDPTPRPARHQRSTRQHGALSSPRHRPVRPPLVARGERRLVVEEPGPATTVQDSGRLGVASLGVPRAGPADPLAHELANRLVGNLPGAAALEATLAGPVLRLHADAVVAVVGDAAVRVDGHWAPGATPLPLSAGQTVTVGALRGGVRAVVAVSGGVQVPTAVGSMASDLLCGLGIGPLRAGDELALGVPGRPAGRLRWELLARPPLADWSSLVGIDCPARPTAVSAGEPGPPEPSPATVHVVPGPDADDWAMALLTTTTWVLQADSDRVGARLAPSHALAGQPRPAHRVPGSPAASRGVVTGTVQLPPDGHPIVLLCDHATTGGYPVPATVCSVDVATVAQLRPGARLRFVETTPGEALARRRTARRLLDAAVVGAFPVRAG